MLALAALVGTGACAEGHTPKRASAKDAYCEAHVRGVGVVDVERVYLPRVLACEHGNASDAALRAQAIAARSYLYYRLDRVGWIRDGQMDQVFSCRREPDERHHAAVLDTAFQVLAHDGHPVAGFYVSGAFPRRRGCRGGRTDPDRTERYVTYNDGQRGKGVRRSPIGARARANRGCMSQRGADCLATRGWRAHRILRFYYGDDIDVVRANPTTCGPAAPDEMDPDVRMALWSFGGAACFGLVVLFVQRRRIPARGRKRKRKRKR